MFGTSVANCSSSTVAVNYWPDSIESEDKTFLYMAARRSSTNGPGLINWSSTPDSTVLGNDNYNLTNIVAKETITGQDVGARAESCAFAVPVGGFGFVGNPALSPRENYIISAMSQFNIVGHTFAEEVMNSFQPAGGVGSDGLIHVSCDAVAPGLFAMIGGTALDMNTVDMIVRTGGMCYSAFQAARVGEVLKLGQPFLKNVGMRVGWDLSVTFTSRPFYAA